MGLWAVVVVAVHLGLLLVEEQGLATGSHTFRTWHTLDCCSWKTKKSASAADVRAVERK